MKNQNKFELGKILVTAGVHKAMQEDTEFSAFCGICLGLHHSGYWGDLCDEDKAVNDESLLNGGRIMSAYEYKRDPSKKIWILTEADRSATTILFPDEY